MAKKVVNRNLGPEMAKKAYEAKLDWKGVIDPWEDNKKQKPTGDSTKVRVVPGKTRVGPLARGGAGLGGMLGRNLK